MDGLETIKKLMALALNSPNAEEARSAALKAVQLIQSQGITLQPKAQPRPPTIYDYAAYDAYRSQAHEAQQDAMRKATYEYAKRFYQGMPYVWPGKGVE